MRRVPRSTRTGLEFSTPARKGKCALNHSWSVDAGRIIDETTYKRHKAALARQQSNESVLVLMKETAANRREWIKKDRPTIKNVLEEFPCLKDFTVVRTLCKGNALFNALFPIRYASYRALPM